MEGEPRPSPEPDIPLPIQLEGVQSDLIRLHSQSRHVRSQEAKDDIQRNINLQNIVKREVLARFHHPDLINLIDMVVKDRLNEELLHGFKSPESLQRLNQFKEYLEDTDSRLSTEEKNFVGIYHNTEHELRKIDAEIEAGSRSSVITPEQKAYAIQSHIEIQRRIDQKDESLQERLRTGDLSITDYENDLKERATRNINILSSAGREALGGELRKSQEELDRDDEEIISASTQYGTEKKYYWPRSRFGKISKMRSILNQIARNYTQEGTQTQQLLFQELTAVLATLEQSSDPNSKQLGKEMNEEFIRRMHFQSAFLAVYNAGDANGVAQGVNQLYGGLMDTLIRDGGSYSENSEPSANLPIQKAMRWYEQNALRWLNIAVDSNALVNNELIPLLKDYFERNLGPEYQEIKRQYLLYKEASDDGPDAEEKKKFTQKYNIWQEYISHSADSAQIIGENMWSTTLRRVVQDPLIDNLGNIIHDPNDYDDKTKKGKLEFYSRQKNGQNGYFAARRALKGKEWLWTQIDVKRGYKFNMELLKGIDLNTRDLLSLLPGDLEGTLSRTLRTIYAAEAGQQIITDQMNDKAKEDAKSLVQAILGIKKTVDWGVGDSKYVDMTKIVWKMSDFNELFEEARLQVMKDNQLDSLDMSDPRFTNDPRYIEINNRKNILQGFIDRYKPYTDPTHPNFNENLFFFTSKGEDTLLVTYSTMIEPPSSKTGRHIANPDNLRDELQKGADSYLRKPSPDALAKFVSSFGFIGDQQVQRAKQIVLNYILWRREGSGSKEKPKLRPLDEEALIIDLGNKVGLDKEARDLIRFALRSNDPLMHELLLLMEQLPFGAAFLDAIWELVKETMQAAVKSK